MTLKFISAILDLYKSDDDFHDEYSFMQQIHMVVGLSRKWCKIDKWLQQIIQLSVIIILSAKRFWVSCIFSFFCL